MRRRCRPRVAPRLVVAGVLLVAGCSSDGDPTGTATATVAPTTVVPGEPVPLDEVELGARNASSAVRVGDTTYVLDGLHRAEGDRAQLRIWMLDGSTPTEAVPVDLPTAGALWGSHGVWFDDQLVVSGTPCHDWYDWYDARDPQLDDEPPCAVEGADQLLTIDPITWRIEELEGFTASPGRGIGLKPEPDGTLLVTAGERERSLLRMVDLETAPERIADDPSGSNCFIGDDLVVIGRVRSSDIPTPLLPLHELYAAEVLRDGTWVRLELPVTDLDGTDGELGGCTGNGLLVGRNVVGGFDDPSEPDSVELRVVEGALAWVPLPVTDAAGRRVEGARSRGGGVFGTVARVDSAKDAMAMLLDGQWVVAPGIDSPQDPMRVIDEEVGSVLVWDGDGLGYDPRRLELLVLRP